MEWFDNGWGISLVVFVPLVGALALLLVPRKDEETAKWLALLTATGSLFFAVVAAFRFDYGDAGALQLGTKLDWIPAIGSDYEIGIDGISSSSSRPPSSCWPSSTHGTTGPSHTTPRVSWR